MRDIMKPLTLKEAFENIWMSGGIPREMPEEFSKPHMASLIQQSMAGWLRKHSLQRDFGMYAFVAWSWVNPLADYLKGKRVLEIMAGAGWLAKALRTRGIDIIATDYGVWAAIKKWPMQTEIQNSYAVRAVRDYGKDCDYLVISWPWTNSDAYYAIRAYHIVNPQGLIIFIGEWGGCTANKLFFEHVEVVNDPAFKLASNQYRNFWGVNDKLYLLKYKP